MDITRGSRRARHVAATHANANTRANANAASSPGAGTVTSEIASSPVPQFTATPSGPPARLQPSQGASPAASIITPDGPPLHRTPDQPPDQRRRRAPPPNPFRLYRTNMPPRRHHFNSRALPPRRINPDHRIKRVPLGELPFKKNSGSLLCRRHRVVRPLPSWEPEDKENEGAFSRAVDHIDATLQEHISDIREEIAQAREIYQTINNLLAAPPVDGPRLSMPPVDSDGSSSEPDESILQNRGRVVATPAGPSPQVPSSFISNRVAEQDIGREALSPEEYEDENSIDEEDIDEEEDVGEQDQAQDVAHSFDPATAGLKEISNLARFTVSSHKPGNGVEQLKSDDLKHFWQSDGPQPHKLTMYFTKRVGIRDIRFYVDFNEDESYTPTKVAFKAGTSENNLIEFATMALENPSGWQQVPIAGAGGDPDGNTLVAWVVQMQILENHQNGKDTHLRGIKIYSFDNDSALGPGRDGNPIDDVLELLDRTTDRPDGGATHYEPGEGGLTIPDFMREPEIR
ncbi:anaphase-promoting complex subunit 10 [Fusarium heterosporum]|uniref:Anaphase-promoting complex subunit 10 n=1 Tax=Fusarium heterosporum TaxID=42747 RepID=A0A8H5TUD5_FUSHE|nr:anaphase-promoting complex subunit 10 [Fusarium heterosporum]